MLGWAAVSWPASLAGQDLVYWHLLDGLLRCSIGGIIDHPSSFAAADPLDSVAVPSRWVHHLVYSDPYPDANFVLNLFQCSPP